MKKKKLLAICIFLFSSQFRTFNCFAQVISGGSYHSLALCNDSTARSWGNNYYGQLGKDTTYRTGCQCDSISVPVSGLTGVIALAGGWFHSLALKNNGTVLAWGRNEYGQLGNGTYTDTTTPIQVGNLSGITAISSKGYHSVALKNDSTVWTWGLNQYYQLGDGTNLNRTTPVQVSGLTRIISIAAGVWHSLALKNDGTVWAWGYNAYGQLGNPTIGNTPVQVIGLSGIVAIVGGEDHSLALKNDGTIWAWGYNKEGELGDSTKTERHIPVQVSLITGVTAIAAGDWYSFALKNDGTVWAWGMNSSGQLGNVTIKNTGPGTTWDSVPRQVNGISGCTAIAGGREQTLALKNDGTLWAWGQNSSGELGNGITGTIGCKCDSVPTQVSPLCQVMQPKINATGITQLTGNNNQEMVYPNPSSGIFNMNEKMNSEISVYNFFGEKICSQKATSGNTKLDLNNHAEGIYFVRIFSEGKSQTEKIIISR